MQQSFGHYAFASYQTDGFSGQEKPRALNFIWIPNKKQKDRALWRAKSPLKPDHAENLQKHARQYDDMDIFLWVDFSLMNVAQTQYFEKLADGIENLSLRDIREISQYNEDPLFSKMKPDYKDNGEPIWQKVDYARVLVLHHLLSTQDYDQAFYCDLDIVDPQFDTPRAIDLMNRNKAVFARSNRDGDDDYVYLENQVIGFHRDMLMALEDGLLPLTRAQIEEGENGWGALIMFVEDHFEKSDSAFSSISVRTYELESKEGQSAPQINELNEP